MIAHTVSAPRPWIQSQVDGRVIFQRAPLDTPASSFGFIVTMPLDDPMLVFRLGSSDGPCKGCLAWAAALQRPCLVISYILSPLVLILLVCRQ